MTNNDWIQARALAVLRTHQEPEHQRVKAAMSVLLDAAHLDRLRLQVKTAELRLQSSLLTMEALALP